MYLRCPEPPSLKLGRFLSWSSQYQWQYLNVAVEIEFGVDSKQCATHAVPVDVVESFRCCFITFCVKFRTEAPATFASRACGASSHGEMHGRPALQSVAQSSSGEALVRPSEKGYRPLVLMRQSAVFANWPAKLPKITSLSPHALGPAYKNKERVRSGSEDC
jgi:hypothetical protein